MLRIFFTLLCLSLAQASYAQLITPTRLLASGINIRMETLPAAVLNDTAKFGFTRFSAQGIMPIRGGAGVKLHNFNLRKIDIEINQVFLAVNVGYRTQRFSFERQGGQPVLTASAAITGIHASLRDKAWIYAVGLGVSETEALFTKETARPYGIIGGARLHILGLNTQYFYGGAVLFEPGRITPVPIVGLNARFGKNNKLTVILPIQASYSRKVGDKTWAEVGIGAGGFNSGYLLKNFGPEAVRLAYRQGRASFTINHSPIKMLQLSAEAGLSTLRSLKIMNAGVVKENFTLRTAPFVSVSCYFSPSRSILESRGFGSVL